MLSLLCGVASLLFRKRDSFARANAGASAAFCARISVNVVDITLRDSAYGALINTCTASDTVVTNYISHNKSCL